jgi:4-hydroxyproline epimerase
VRGDVAWGGNWFFLVSGHDGHDPKGELALQNVDRLTAFTWAIRQALTRNGITGDDGKEIDHIELFVPSQVPGVDSKNFVLCPGKAYDRSPCGTGTSAKLACLFADGKIREGQVWRQESIVGSVFEGSVRVRNGKVYPSITGWAFVNAEADLVFDPRDPLAMGIRA